MAIPRSAAEALCAEHAWRSFPRSVLLLGRQSVTFDAPTLLGMAAKWGLPAPAIEIDTATLQARANPDRQWVSDACFLAMLGVTEIHAIDHSDYEGADIILDICQPIPPAHAGRYELIFNGSVLDNVHDTAAALRNIGALCAPHGRVVHLETATPTRYSYSALSPSWFFDWAVVNGWADCKLAFGSARDWAGVVDGPWAMLGFDPNAEPRPNAFTPNIGGELGVQLVIAEKGADSTHHRTPTQAHYRSDADWDRFVALAAPIRASRRPFYMGQDGTGEAIAGYGGVWRSCGHW
jgi:hypothetical protein